MGSLFIGLGGVGTGTLDHLSKKMDVYNEDLQRQGRPQVSAIYYYIDTENARYSQHQEEFMGGTNKTFHQIGALAPDSIIRAFSRDTSAAGMAQYELSKKWYEAPAKTTNMIKGADTIRKYSRLAFAYESTRIRGDLFTLIQQVTRQQGRIYVITGSCGGTGCGIYLDILYMISEIYANQTTPTSSTDARLIMAMPEGYVADGQMDVQYEKKRLNAFATLEELNAICKDKNSNPSLFNGCYVGPVLKNGVFQPFRFGYLFDSALLKRDEVSQKVADFLFELELAGDPYHGMSTDPTYTGSFFDGLMTGTVDGNWNASINNNYVQAFNALGQYSIEKPDFLFRTYFSDRLLFEVFHEGLIGKKELIDSQKVTDLTGDFRKNIIDAETTNTLNTIKGTIVSKDDFATDVKANNMFSVFTKAPNMDIEVVKTIINKRNVLLQTVKSKVYNKCKEWLGQYDFATVYAMFDELDRQAYKAAGETHADFDDLLAKAKKNSEGGLIRSGIKPDKALGEFEQLLHTWLTFEVNKSLSSGVEVDIAIQNQGFLDHCKYFIERAKRRFVLENEQEHWDEFFVKKVTDLKAKDDRSYIPDLNTIVDDNSRIIPDSFMVNEYDNVRVKHQEPSFTQGTCTPVTLHERIIGEMKSNVSLRQEGIDMDEIFDPTPSKTSNLNNASRAQLFVEKYIKFAEEQINALLESNDSFQQLFGGDILERLQNLPVTERTKKCVDFVNYDKVQLKTDDMAVGAVTTYTYYILSSVSNVPLMKALGIFDAAGNKAPNSDHTPDNPFFGDKIVKLIVKNGYKMDDYRYFEDYKENAEEKMVDGQTHDPFIDKRFLGEPDEDGKYPCNVSEALTKIATDARAAMQADEYSLDGFNNVEIYKFGLALLYEYFETLKTKGGQIDADLENAIVHVSGTHSINIQQPTYNKLRRKHTLGAAKTIDLASLTSINNMENLTTWINYIRQKKDSIENEAELYGKALEDFGLTLASDLEEMIGNMMGDGNKPIYDFFTAYLGWYNRN